MYTMYAREFVRRFLMFSAHDWSRVFPPLTARKMDVVTQFYHKTTEQTTSKIILEKLIKRLLRHQIGEKLRLKIGKINKISKAKLYLRDHLSSFRAEI